MKKRIFAVMMCICLLLSSMSLLAYARASYYLANYNIVVGDRGNGVVRVTATVNATHPYMTQLGFPVVVLYEKVNGSWVAVRTNSGIYKYNSGSHGYQYDYQGVVGKEYMAYSSFAAQDTTGGDSRDANSNAVTLK